MLPPGHSLHKILNRNTVKLSYRTMPNMKQVLSMHNSKVAYRKEQTPPSGCNCRGGVAVCPLEGVCQTTGVVYEDKVVRGDNNKQEFFTGVTVGPFKTRLYGSKNRESGDNKKVA